MTAALLDGALLRAVARLEDEVHALREAVHAQGDALRAVRDALAGDPAPAVAVPPAAGGGVAPADFPSAFRGRTGGQPRDAAVPGGH